ncbi:MAG: outer membrane protein assembly factor BamA [Bacteroidetes bacterium]|nr:outer membrane protein assembly factor BamA [Bacteroidota bacterium]
MKKIFAALFRVICFMAALQPLAAQTTIGGLDNFEVDFTNPKEYEIGGVTVTGIKFLDENALKTIAGLNVGERVRVPGEKFSNAIENLWKQGVLTDVKIVVTNIKGDNIFLELQLAEKPRLSYFTPKGVTKGQFEKVRDKINVRSGDVVTDNLIKTTQYVIEEHFIDKGFLNAKCNIETITDSLRANQVVMIINVDRGRKVKINKIYIADNTAIKDVKIKRKMKDTKERHWYRLFKTSKYIEENLEKDKEAVIEKYHEKGFRDARINLDSVVKNNRKSVDLYLTAHEGNTYYFRNVNWIGNTKYRSGQLDTILGIKKGDVFNQKQMDQSLYMSQSGQDVQSLYMDDGYLFFQITPAEVSVENDSIDLEMRIYEGKQATINRVYITGNTKTHDRVVLREVYTKPGQLFNRSDVIRTVRELAQLGYFDQEKLVPVPKPNPADGTVDIEYQVEERPSDQLELSGGYGGNQLVGTLGLSFTNFSLRNIFKGREYTPLPSGDGQKLAIRAQSSGSFYQSYNLSFTEPWLGGRKPNSFTGSIFHTIRTNGKTRSDPQRTNFKLSGISFGLGKRLKWPDNFFSLYHELSFNLFDVTTPDGQNSFFIFKNGKAQNISYSVTLSRNSVDAPIFPRRGGSLSFIIAATPPFSTFRNIDYATATPEQKYKWIEYHKWKFNTTFFTKITGNLVMATRLNFGFLGLYNRTIGAAPFERFYVGGDGMSGFDFDGREIIAMRGYDNQAVTPQLNRSTVGATIYNKYTLELRYPVSLNPSATIYGLAFAEAGNSFLNFKEYSPFSVKRSAGIGVRIFLPMFGLLGLDYGYGFDAPVGQRSISKGKLQFTIGQQF